MAHTAHGMSGQPSDAAVDGVYEDLVERLLAGHVEPTRRTYLRDIAAFARFRGVEPAGAIAELLGGGPLEGRRLLLEYVVELRLRDSAPATIGRRLSTLRTLARTARESGLIDWALEAPDDEEISLAMDQLALGGVPYPVPRHPGEVDRLDLQHYAFREALGRNYLAPIERPRLVLDAGAGTGQWGFDLCDQFPKAHVVGLDLVPGKPRRQPRYHTVRANLLRDLPFPDDRFDFVHQRLLVTAVPPPAWPALVGELVRVTRPGGWIELVEPQALQFDRTGPAMERFGQLARAAATRLGLDVTSIVYRSLDAYLRDAGAERVTREEVQLPVGEWGGRVGSMMATDYRVVLSSLGPVLAAAGEVEPEEVAGLIDRVQREYEELQVSASLAIAYGKKPA
jgi:SAM-dependent methyltransferase